MLSPVKIWRNQGNIAKLAGKSGKIMSWTMIRVPPCNFSCQAPYPVTIVELSGGVKICAQMVDWAESDLKTGRKVQTVIRRIVIESNTDGIIPYGIKVKPV